MTFSNGSCHHDTCFGYHSGYCTFPPGTDCIMKGEIEHEDVATVDPMQGTLFDLDDYLAIKTISRRKVEK